MKYDFDQLKLMHNAGFHLLSANDKKMPINERDGIRQWKYLTTEKQEWQAVQKWSTHPNHHFYGYCTGVNGIEVLDVDLKVIHDIEERKTIWEDFISFARDNIDSFDSKFAIYKTLNFGYHIVYRTSHPQGNKKLAKLKGSKEALFETRGAGGYAVVYTTNYNGLEYHQAQLITEEERQILWQIAKYYDYKEPDLEPQQKLKGNVEPNGNRLTTWDDFNQRNSVWDVIRDDFKVVRDSHERTIIKRHGAESAHSGYIFKQDQILYLFSTGTNYPAEKPLNPFQCYVWKEHNGNYERAAKELYQIGYGDRYVKEKPKIETTLEREPTHQFPIDVLPSMVQAFILDANRTLSTSIDYMACTYLWCCSLIIGNNYRVQIKNGWEEACSMWIALVGKPGIGKTPSINLMAEPLKKINGQRIKEFNRKYREYQQYQKLDKNEKKTAVEVEEPIKDQFIVDDLTTEALAELHEKVPNGIGVLKDEMNGWVKEMNRYRPGSDLEFWLSSWSNSSVNVVRKISRSSYVEKAFIPVLGGIQPGIISQVFTTENKENGFVDRLLLSFPDLVVDRYNSNEMTKAHLEYYEFHIQQFNKYCSSFAMVKEDKSIQPNIIRFSKQAEAKWQEVFNEITDKQNSEDENEYMKSMLPKQKSYIPRFALVFHLLECFDNGQHPSDPIAMHNIEKAKKLSDYFISMSRKIKIENMEIEALNKAESNLKGTDKEKVLAILEMNPSTNKAKLAERFNITTRTIRRWLNEQD